MTIGIIQTEISGRQAGLDSLGNLVLNKPDGSTAVLGGGRALSPSGQFVSALLTVVAGNSIMNQAKVAANVWNYIGEIQWSSALNGGLLRFGRMTASTRADEYGVYGYSGQTIATINADLDAQWYVPLATAGIVPDLVILGALTENDISAGTAIATIQGGITEAIRKVQATWPGVRIQICTSRPSFSNDTAAKVAAYQTIRDYILALDDGQFVFATLLNGYESGTSPGTPKSVAFTGSISATTLTVTVPPASGDPIGPGHYLLGTGVTAATKITANGTGVGKGGTYTITPSQTSTPTSMALYTDDSVHPQFRGALLNARAMAATQLRIARAGKRTNPRTSTNLVLAGSGAASGTGVTGTVPTSCTVTGSANGTFVAAAEAPGFSITANNSAYGYRTDLSTADCGTSTYTGPTQISPFCTIQIVSGAENLRFVQPEYRITDGGGLAFRYHLSAGSQDQDTADWQNGDVLTFITPPIIPLSGAFSTERTYIRWMMKQNTTAPVTFRIINQGFETVSTA